MSSTMPPDCAVVIATSLALIDQFQQSLGATNISTDEVTGTADHPSPLLLCKAAAQALKSTTTKLSLLSITPPFTPSALVSQLKLLNDSILPSLVTAALLVTPAQFPESFAAELTRLIKVSLTELKSLLELVIRRSKDRKPKLEPTKAEKQNLTETTGRLWESCDGITKFCDDGIPGFVVDRAEQWLALMKDAVQELQEWDPEEDVDEDVFGDMGSDEDDPDHDEGDTKDHEQATIAAGVKDQALRVLSRIPQSIHVTIKQRLAKMPSAIKSGEGKLSTKHKNILNSVLKNVRNISECIDESAEAMYMGNPELCLRKAGEARAITISTVESLLPAWEAVSLGIGNSKEDTFMQRALLWIQQVDTNSTKASNGQHSVTSKKQ